MTVKTIQDLRDVTAVVYGKVTEQTLRYAYELLSEEEKMNVMGDLFKERAAFCISAFSILLESKDSKRSETARKVFWSQIARTEEPE